MEKELFNDLLSSINEMVAIEKGEMTVNPENVHRHAIPDVKSIRKSIGINQAEFAKIIGASSATIQSWELNRQEPSGIALKCYV